MLPSSRSANASSYLGLAALLGACIGAAGAHFGALAPRVGFVIFQLSLLSGLLALIMALPGLWTTRAAAGRSGRGAAWLGLALGGALLGLGLWAASPGQGLPIINDITTDPADPPRFRVDAEGRDLSYAGEAFAAAQRQAYPDLAPLRVEAPPAVAFERARRAAQALGWEIVLEDRAGGHLEARDVSSLFRFVDDVVVRVRADGTSSRIDVRSKSRDGRGDLGVNAARIRAFAAALHEAT